MVRSPEQTAPRPPDGPDGGSPAESVEDQPAVTLPPLLPKKRWPRRVLITMNVFVAVCLLVTGSAYGYFEWRVFCPSKNTLPRGVPPPPGKPWGVLERLVLGGGNPPSPLHGRP